MSTSGAQYPASVAAGTVVSPTTPVVESLLAVQQSGTNWSTVQAPSFNADGAGTMTVLVSTLDYAMTGASSADRLRTPAVFKSPGSVSAAGDSAVWTPAAGKKFRLMGYQIFVPNSATIAVAGQLIVFFDDGATAMPLRHILALPNAASTAPGGWTTGPVSLGNGILSAVANNVLNINLGVALTAGVMMVNVWGTEE